MHFVNRLELLAPLTITFLSWVSNFCMRMESIQQMGKVDRKKLFLGYLGLFLRHSYAARLNKFKRVPIQILSLQTWSANFEVVESEAESIESLTGQRTLHLVNLRCALSLILSLQWSLQGSCSDHVFVVLQNVHLNCLAHFGHIYHLTHFGSQTRYLVSQLRLNLLQLHNLGQLLTIFGLDWVKFSTLSLMFELQILKPFPVLLQINSNWNGHIKQSNDSI